MEVNKDTLGRFKPGFLHGTPFEKGRIPWNKGKIIADLDGEKIKDLYVSQYKSAWFISKLMKRSPTTISKFLVREGIELRPIGKISKIKKMEDWEASWLAGVIDGEGCITRPRIKPSSTTMTIANINLEFLSEVIKKTNGGKIYRKKEYKNFYRKNPCYTLYFSVNEMLDLLPQILPYLVIKKEKAIKTLKIYEKRRAICLMDIPVY